MIQARVGQGECGSKNQTQGLVTTEDAPLPGPSPKQLCYYYGLPGVKSPHSDNKRPIFCTNKVWQGVQ